MLQIIWSATPWYGQWWFWVLLVLATGVLVFYLFIGWTRRRYRNIIAARKKANARIRALLQEMRDRE